MVSIICETFTTHILYEHRELMLLSHAFEVSRNTFNVRTIALKRHGECVFQLYQPLQEISMAIMAIMVIIKYKVFRKNKHIHCIEHVATFSMLRSYSFYHADGGNVHKAVDMPSNTVLFNRVVGLFTGTTMRATRTRWSTAKNSLSFIK